MSALTWLLEKDCFEDSEPRLIDSIKKAGQAYELVEYIPVIQETGWSNMNHEKGPGPFVFHGSINLGKVIGRYDPYLNLFCTWKNYKCSLYHSIPYIQRLLLNDCGIFYPYGGLKQILSEYVKSGATKVFIRPDGGAKSFSGTIVELGNSAIDKFFYQCELYEQIKSEDLCLVAPIRDDIIAEYRCIVINNKAITCSRYKLGGFEFKTRPQNGFTCDNVDNPYITDYVNHFLENCNYRPDACFTVDVALTNKTKPEIIEFNSFSCAGMYGCNTDKIVKAMGDMLCS